MNAATMEQIFTAGEVGRMLGVSAQTVARWTRDGLLVAGKPERVKLNSSAGVGRRRYTNKDVEDFRRVIARPD